MQNLKVITIPQMNLQYKEDTARPVKSARTVAINTTSSGATFSGVQQIARSIGFQGGSMFVNGETVTSYYSKNAYVWEREKNGVPIETGCVWLYHYGLMCEGYVEQNGQRNEFNGTSECKYDLYYKRKDNTTVTMEFRMGVRLDTTSKFYVSYGELYYEGQLVVDGDQQIKISMNGDKLHIQIDASLIHALGLAPEGFYAEMLDFDLSLTYEEAENGFVIETDTEERFNLTGEILNENSAAMTSARLHTKYKKAAVAGLKASYQQMNAVGANSAVGAVSTNSINELFTLTAPDMEIVQKKSSEVLYYLAVYHVSDLDFTYKAEKPPVAWNTWFNMTKERAKTLICEVDPKILTLTHDIEIANYLNSYAKACLANAYSGSTDESIREAFIGAVNAGSRCRYYMQGSSETSMCKDPGFNKAIMLISKYVYSSMVPNFKKYFTDNPKQWAKLLYERCLASLAQLSVQQLAGGTWRINHLCMMLNFLDDTYVEIEDKDGESVMLPYGGALYAKVLNMQLSEMMDALVSNAEEKSEALAFFKLFFSKFYDELQKEQSDIVSADILKEFQAEMAEYAKTMGKLSSDDLVSKSLELITEFMNLLEASGAPSALKQLAGLGRKTKKAGAMTNYAMAKIAAIGIYSYMIYQCSKVFFEWNQSTPIQQTESIVACIGVFLNVSTEIGHFAAMKTLVNAEASVADKMNAALRLKFGGEGLDTIKALSKSGGMTIKEGMMEAAKYNASIKDAGGQAIRVSNWTRLFQVLEVAVRIVNILLMGLVVVLVSYEIANDIKNGLPASIIAMDFLQAISLGVAAIIEGAVLFAEVIGVICNVIPVIGAAIVFIGIIFTIVGSVLKSNYKEPIPVLEFIKKELVPFVNHLVFPPADWQTVKTDV